MISIVASKYCFHEVSRNQWIILFIFLPDVFHLTPLPFFFQCIHSQFLSRCNFSSSNAHLRAIRLRSPQHFYRNCAPLRWILSRMKVLEKRITFSSYLYLISSMSLSRFMVQGWKQWSSRSREIVLMKKVLATLRRRILCCMTV